VTHVSVLPFRAGTVVVVPGCCIQVLGLFFVFWAVVPHQLQLFVLIWVHLVVAVAVGGALGAWPHLSSL